MTKNHSPSVLHVSLGVATLDETDCRLRLRSGNLGRIAVKLGNDFVILPVYYAVMDEDIVFRTAPGTKLSAAILKTKVAFEVDDRSPGWSVLVQGHAAPIREHDVQVRARELLGSDWPAGVRDQLVRIRAERITGRQLVPPT